MNKQTRIIFITLLSFGLYFLIDELYFRSLRSWLNEFFHQLGTSHLIAYIMVGVPIFVGTYCLHTKKFFDALGFGRSIFKAFIFALLCTLPMFLGYSLLSGLNHEYTLNQFLVSAIAAAFFEELYFRGFLFGQLYRYTRLGFIPSVFLGAVIFGLIHLYQGTDVSELLGIFAVTFMGGILFAWVYVEWRFNLWVPIFLHLLMNLSWDICAMGNSALGNGYANLFRLITIALIIILTITCKKRKKMRLEVNRNSVWMEKASTN